jgi:hypothetical protein
MRFPRSPWLGGFKSRPHHPSNPTSLSSHHHFQFLLSETLGHGTMPLRHIVFGYKVFKI